MGIIFDCALHLSETTSTHSWPLLQQLDYAVLLIFVGNRYLVSILVIFFVTIDLLGKDRLAWQEKYAFCRACQSSVGFCRACWSSVRWWILSTMFYWHLWDFKFRISQESLDLLTTFLTEKTFTEPCQWWMEIILQVKQHEMWHNMINV